MEYFDVEHCFCHLVSYVWCTRWHDRYWEITMRPWNDYCTKVLHNQMPIQLNIVNFMLKNGVANGLLIARKSEWWCGWWLLFFVLSLTWFKFMAAVVAIIWYLRMKVTMPQTTVQTSRRPMPNSNHFEVLHCIQFPFSIDLNWFDLRGVERERESWKKNWISMSMKHSRLSKSFDRRLLFSQICI